MTEDGCNGLEINIESLNVCRPSCFKHKVKNYEGNGRCSPTFQKSNKARKNTYSLICCLYSTKYMFSAQKQMNTLLARGTWVAG